MGHFLELISIEENFGFVKLWFFSFSVIFGGFERIKEVGVVAGLFFGFFLALPFLFAVIELPQRFGIDADADVDLFIFVSRGYRSLAFAAVKGRLKGRDGCDW